MTDTEIETLQQKLAQQNANDLAAFIVNLAVANEEVHQAVKIFALRCEPKELVKAIRARMAELKRSKRYYNYSQSGELSHKLDTLLDLIQRELIPSMPEKAIDLLGAFIEMDNIIFNHADDSGGNIGMNFRRAAKLLATACETAEATDIGEQWFLRLTAKNDYGARDVIYDLAPQLLSEFALQRVLDSWYARYAEMPQTEAYNSQRHTLEVCIGQVAKATGNAELYAKVWMKGQTPQQKPDLAMQVAEIYLARGDTQQALAYVPKNCTAHGLSKAQKLLIRIHDAMGNPEQANIIRLDYFKQSPCEISALDWLKQLPESKQEVGQLELRRIVDQGDYDLTTRTRLYIAWGDVKAAANAIESNISEADQLSYYTQSELAKALADSQPKAASILLRGAAEQTLKEARTKNYSHAVRYIKQLMQLAESVKIWGDIIPHEIWWAAFRQAHTRKSAFVTKLNAAGID
ncbi:MAG: chemotaxis protein histidine kinase CheA [Lentimonas sp.]|jgi:chemotaxis protein histidine kinase CheA